MKNSFWIRGQRTKLAKSAGIGLNHLSEILHRKRGVSYRKALELYAACVKVLGHTIPVESWFWNKETKHPAFFGKPIKKGRG